MQQPAYLLLGRDDDAVAELRVVDEEGKRILKLGLLRGLPILRLQMRQLQLGWVEPVARSPFLAANGRAQGAAWPERKARPCKGLFVS